MKHYLNGSTNVNDTFAEVWAGKYRIPASMYEHACQENAGHLLAAVGRVALNLPHPFAILLTPFVIDVSLPHHTPF